MAHSIKANLSQTAFPEEGGETECRIEIDPDTAQTEQLPLHIVFCVDKSGSMSGSEISQAKTGVENAMSKLNSRDKFGVVAFDNEAEVVVHPTSGSQASSTNLGSISAGGGTHIINGLEKSRELLESMGGGVIGSSNERAVKWIALVTDGNPSDISSSLSTLISGFTGSNFGGAVEKHGAVGETLNNQGITVNTAGVGTSYGENIIEAISVRSGGTWEHHSSASGIETFFKNKITEAHNVVVTNPTLRFTPKNGVGVRDVKRTVPQIAEVEYEQNAGEYIVTDFPDIRRDISPEYIFDLNIPAHEIDPDVTFAEVTLEIGSDVLSSRVSGEYTLDNEIARDMDTGIKTIKTESETANNYLGKKDTYDKRTKEAESTAIARKRD
ncbi:vWA domain-containing protein [Natrialbaceae archaeon A-CW1-1]